MNKKAKISLWILIAIIFIALILMTSLIIAPNQSKQLKISSTNPSWKTVKISGIESNLSLVISNASAKKTDFCWYFKDGVTPTASQMLDKSLFYSNGTCIKDDKSKCIVGIKYETSKCNVNGTMKNGFHLSLTTAQSININSDFKLGNESWVESYQNESKVIYQEDKYNLTATLYKWNGNDYIIAPQDIFINNTNENKLKFGAIDLIAKNKTKYQYEFISTKPIQYSNGIYYIDEGMSLKVNQYFLKNQIKKIDTSDICKKGCAFNLINSYYNKSLAGINFQFLNYSKLTVTFNADYNSSLGYVLIDPTLEETYSNVSTGFFNLTKSTDLGIRLLGSTVTIGSPTTASGVIFYNEGSYSASWCTHIIRVYAYKEVGGNRVYSPSYAESNQLDDDGSSTNYRIPWSWDEVSGATGYRLLKYGGCGGYTYDYYVDVVGVTSYNDDAQANWQSGNTVTPTSGEDLTNFSLSGDYKSYIFYNTTSPYWNVTLGYTSTSGNNITMQTRTGNYNLSDPALAGFWSFNNEAGTNSTYFIDIKNGRNATCSTCPVYNDTVAPVGGNYYFDGTSYMEIPDNDDWDLRDENFTISLWARETEYNQARVLISRDYDTTYGSWLMYAAEIGIYHMVVFVGSQSCTSWDFSFPGGFGGGGYILMNPYSEASPKYNEWHHYLVTRNGYNLTSYYDGNLVESLNVSKQYFCNRTGAMTIGMGQTGYQNPFIGNLDEIKIYKRGINATEAQNLYQLDSSHIIWNAFSSTKLTNSGTPRTTVNNGTLMQFKTYFKTNDPASTSYLLNHSIGFNPSGETEPDTTGPVCTLVSRTPSNIVDNSTGVLTVIMNCTDPSGINLTKSGDHYPFFISRTVDAFILASGIPNYWSNRYPNNSLGVTGTLTPPYKIWRALGRNEGYWYDNLTGVGISDCTGLSPCYAPINDTFSYAIEDGDYGHFTVTPENASLNTSVIINYTHPAVDISAFRQSVYLSYESMVKEGKKNFTIDKTNYVLTKRFDAEAYRGTQNYMMNSFRNFVMLGVPTKTLRAFYCNSSYNPAGSVQVISSPNCALINSLTSTEINNRVFTDRNSTYSKGTYGITNGKFAGIVATGEFYIEYESPEAGANKGYNLRYVNGSTNTDVKFNDTKVAWTSTNQGTTWTQASWTPDIFTTSTRSANDEFEFGYYFKDLLGNAGYNFTFFLDEITTTNHPISSPLVLEYNSTNNPMNIDLNGTYSKVMTIRIGVSKDPDSVGNVTHNLSLFNPDGTFNYTINASFLAPLDAPIWITFNTSLVPDGIYRMNILATSGDNSLDTKNRTTDRNLTIDNINPNATLLYPANGTSNSTVSQNLTVNITDNLGIKNASLYINGVFNQTITFTGNVISTVVGITVNLIQGVYTWFYQIFDLGDNSFTTQNNTLTITAGCIGATKSFGCGENVTENCTFNGNMLCNDNGLITGGENITINCAGYSLNYSKGSANKDGILVNSNGVTIKNCKIEEDGATDISDNIHLASTNAKTYNNTLITHFFDSHNINIAGNNNNVSSNYLTDASGGPSIIVGGLDNLIDKNNFTNTEACIGLRTGSDRSNITNNNITCPAYGVNVEHDGVDNNYIAFNTMNVGTGIFLTGNTCLDSRVVGNTITATSFGIDLASTATMGTNTGWLIDGNKIIYSLAGIRLGGSDTNITNNDISGGTNAIHMIWAGNNTYFLNNNLSGTNTILDDRTGPYAGFNRSTFIYNNSFGEIRWTSESFLENMDTQGNLVFGTSLIIANNSAYLNSGVVTGNINSSANITLYGIGNRGFTKPAILKDGVKCTDCYNFTSLIASTVVFNVSSWSNYTIGNDCISGSDVYCCDNLATPNLVYNLKNNVTSTGTCFSVLSNNITFSGNGYRISYNSGASLGNTFAFNISDSNNVTIKNVLFEDFGGVANYGFSLYNSNSTYIINTTMPTTAYPGGTASGIYSNSSYNTLVENNSFIDSNGNFITTMSGGNWVINNNNFTSYVDGLIELGGNDNLLKNNYIQAGDNALEGGLLWFKKDNNIIDSNVVYQTAISTPNFIGAFDTDGANNTIHNNIITATNNRALYVVGSYDVYNNTFTTIGGDSAVKFVNPSSNNNFFDNRINSNTLGIILDTQDSLINFTNCIWNTTNAVIKSSPLANSGENVVINLINITYLNNQTESIGSYSGTNLFRRWYYEANVKYVNGTNARLNFTLTNVSNYYFSSGITDVNGLSGLKVITAYEKNGSRTLSWLNFNASVLTNSSIFNFSSSRYDYFTISLSGNQTGGNEGGGSGGDTGYGTGITNTSDYICRKTYLKNKNQINDIIASIKLETNKTYSFTDIEPYITYWQQVCSDRINFTNEPKYVCEKLYYFLVSNNYRYTEQGLLSLKESLKDRVIISTKLLNFYALNYNERCYLLNYSDKINEKIQGIELNYTETCVFDLNKSLLDLYLPLGTWYLSDSFECRTINKFNWIFKYEQIENSFYFLGIRLYIVIIFIIILITFYLIRRKRNQG